MTTRMAKILYVRPLMANQFRQAFALIRLTAPHLALDNWIRYAEALGLPESGDAGGIVSAHSADGYIYGLCCYRLGPDSQHRHTLVVEHFVALDLVDKSAIVRALIDAIERVALEHRCTQVHFTLPRPRSQRRDMDAALHGSLSGAGYEVDGVGLRKRLTSEQRAARAAQTD